MQSQTERERVMNERVQTQFNSLSSEYDANRRRLIPAFDAFYAAGVDFLTYPGESPSVLDIGAGTGIFTARLLDRYPDASVTLLDFSNDMLEIARKKFAGNNRVSFILGDYSETDIGAAGFDIVISALSLHHLNAEDKCAFFAKLSRELRDGVEFVNADIVKHADPALTARFDALWTGFVRGNVGDGGFFDRFIDSKDVDDPSTIEEQLAWLKDFGFSQTCCVYNYYNFAVMYAMK